MKNYVGYAIEGVRLKVSIGIRVVVVAIGMKDTKETCLVQPRMHSAAKTEFGGDHQHRPCIWRHAGN